MGVKAAKKSTPEENSEFWDKLGEQEWDDFNDGRTVPVYLITDCASECDVFVIGALLGDELYKQVKRKGPNLPIPREDDENLCFSGICFYGAWKKTRWGEFVKPREDDEKGDAGDEAKQEHAQKKQLEELFGSPDFNKLRKPRIGYRALLWQKEPPHSSNTPSLELGGLSFCERPMGQARTPEDERCWISSVKKMDPEATKIALGLLAGDAFEDHTVDEDDEDEDGSEDEEDGDDDDDDE